MKLLVAAIFLAVANTGNAANILALFPVPSRSHTILVEPLLEELAGRGHEVTVLTSYKPLREVKNIKFIYLETMADDVKKLLNFFHMRKLSSLINLYVLAGAMTQFTEMLLNNTQVQGLMQSDEQFDVIFSESRMLDAVFAGLSYKRKIPLINLSTFMTNHWSNNLVGNPAPRSYIPDPLLSVSYNMDFVTRFKNTVLGVLNEVLVHLLYFPAQDAVMRKYFGADMPPIQDILKNSSLVLINHHFSLAYPRPYVPNMVEVGGMHVRKPKPLPDEFKTFLDNAIEGAVFFSLGSNAKSDNMPSSQVEELKKGFARINMKVLWKWEADDMPNKPANVLCKKWMPQSDILAHPNIKLFITHGGMLSTTEAVIRGVPIIGIPLFNDQFSNMKVAVAAGIGLSLELDELTADMLVDTINEVVTNPKYRETTQLKSKLLQDTPMSALDTAVFWIEYVIRHKGAPHLRSAVQDLNWIQRNSLDVLLAMLSIVTVMLIVIYCVFKTIFKLLRGKKIQKIETKKKRN